MGSDERAIRELHAAWIDAVNAGEVAYTVCRDSLSVTPRGGGEATELAGHRITIYRPAPSSALAGSAIWRGHCGY